MVIGIDIKKEVVIVMINILNMISHTEMKYLRYNISTNLVVQINFSPIHHSVIFLLFSLFQKSSIFLFHYYCSL